jgi:cob(I)alamin adenosyltransferase
MKNIIEISNETKIYGMLQDLKRKIQHDIYALEMKASFKTRFVGYEEEDLQNGRTQIAEIEKMIEVVKAKFPVKS